MQHLGRVRARDRVGDAGQELDALPPCVRAHRPIGQRAAVDELAHDVLLPVVLADVVHGHDVRMIQARCGLGFLPEPPPRLLVGDAGCEELDRDRAMELRVGRAIDDAHATAAEHGVDPIAADQSAGRELLRGVGLTASCAYVRWIFGRHWSSRTC